MDVIQDMPKAESLRATPDSTIRRCTREIILEDTSRKRERERKRKRERMNLSA